MARKPKKIRYYDEDGDTVFVIPGIHFNGWDINRDVERMHNDTAIYKIEESWDEDEFPDVADFTGTLEEFFYGALSTAQGVTDKQRRVIYWGSDIRDVVRGLED